MAKIALIGAGNIGGMMAYDIAAKGYGDVVMFDIMEGMPQGKSLDITESLVNCENDRCIFGTNSYKDIADADAVIVTAGFPRKPGMSRDDLLLKNAEVISEVGKNIKQYAPKSFVIVVTNPLDVMVQVMQKATEFDKNKVIGMAGILDTSRFCYFLADELGIAVSNISSMVLGGHGDLMVPLIRYTSVAGIPLTEIIAMGLISQSRVDSIIERTRKGGEEVVKLLKTGSAYFAPARSAISMLSAYLYDRKMILPCAAYLSGQYGVNGMYAGVPVIIGKGGVEQIIELKLDEYEQKMFDQSVSSIRVLIDILNSNKKEEKSA